MTLGEALSAIPTGRIHKHDLTFRTGPFVVRLRTDSPGLIEQLERCYPDTPYYREPTIVHFQAGVYRGSGMRRWLRPQAEFTIDGEAPFQPYPADHAYALFEWGLNWSIATRAHNFLMLHAAALEHRGHALLLPAVPGSGKSTLCAALTFRGWRLLSDEFGLIERDGPGIHPLPRSIPLKNASIDIIRRFSPGAELGPIYEKTRKGDVSHLKPSPQSTARQQQTASPRWVLFPRYIAGHPTRLTPLPKSVAFTRLAQNAFNYRLLGEAGFRRLVPLIQGCDCYSLEFSDLDEAIDQIQALPA